jgi:ABC-type multidrug transport system fused ATPase/permease subunit
MSTCLFLDVKGVQLLAMPRVAGNIDFQGITFRYPSRPDIEIFRNFNLSVPAGQVTAVVGPSGCGKSTIFALLLRYYDPDAGRIGAISVQWIETRVVGIK